MGHVKLDQTLRYLDLAKLYDQGKGSWISRALRQHKHVGGMYDLSGKERTNEKRPIFVPFSRRKKYVPDGLRTTFSEDFHSKYYKKCRVWFLQVQLTKNLLFSFFINVLIKSL